MGEFVFGSKVMIFGLIIAFVPFVIAVFSLIPECFGSRKNAPVWEKWLAWLLSSKASPVSSQGDGLYHFRSVRDLSMLVCKNGAKPYDDKKWLKDLSLYTRSELCNSQRELNLCVSSDYEAFLNGTREIK